MDVEAEELESNIEKSANGRDRNERYIIEIRSFG